MTLIVHELVTSLCQRVTVGNRYAHIYAIRPHLYRHGNPSGSLYLEIRKTDGTLIATSESISIASIGSNTYWHGEVRFLITAYLSPATSYDIYLKSSGYTFGESAYIGWCNDFDLRKIEAEYSPRTGLNAALLLEVWTYNQAGKG